MYSIYLRKSRLDLELEARGDMETLARHRKALLEYAEKHDLPVKRVYEEVVSGETIDARPVVRHLLSEVEQGVWEGVLVMEVERLARGDTIDQGIVARAFRVGQAKIVTPIKTYDPQNEFDEEYFEFGLFMSRREYKTITRRIQRGRVSSAKEGKFLGSTAPYGYSKIRLLNDKGYTLAPMPEESSVVRLIFQRYCDGASICDIARELDGMGVRPRKQKNWSRSTISDILSNPVYTGRLRWAYRTGQKYIQDGKLCTKRVINPTPINVPGLHEPLVSDAQFARVQEQRNRNIRAEAKSGRQLQNPLSGLVYCADCGRLMTRLCETRKTPYAFLKCPNNNCKNVSAPLYLVENKLFRLLERLTIELTPNTPDITQSTPAQPQVLADSLAAANKETERLQMQLANAHDLLEQGVYSVDIFSERSNALNARLDEATAKRNALQKKLEQSRCDKQPYEPLPPKLALAEAYAGATSVGEKNALLRLAIARVEYRKSTPNHRGQRDNGNFELHIYPRLGRS